MANYVKKEYVVHVKKKVYDSLFKKDDILQYFDKNLNLTDQQPKTLLLFL